MKRWILCTMLFGCAGLSSHAQIKVSPNKRFFTTADGKPFFWLGDTGWLLFTKLTREQTLKYLDERHKQGFNVIQVMVLHNLSAINVYGDAALINKNVAHPKITPGNNFSDTAQYDYWDHVEYVIDEAAKRGIYIALVPVWGSNVKSGGVNSQQAAAYAKFLAERYRSKPNIIWVNGGDIKGSDSLKVWNTIGSTLHQYDKTHLITFHPRGRTSSSGWFHSADWLSFNMFQSGHRRYNQDTSAGDLHYGEDNWKYVGSDYKLQPVKPTMDGEPSYEGIPQGLHDSTQPYWTANDVRRYAYWSVFAGGAGFTYGNNAVMQFHRPGDKDGSYGVKQYWQDALDAEGAGQLKNLKDLLLAHTYFDRVPDQSLVVSEAGRKYDRPVATRGKDYALIYTYTGQKMTVRLGKTLGVKVKAYWFSPSDGQINPIGTFDNKGVRQFDPPGEPGLGNDWVLILENPVKGQMLY